MTVSQAMERLAAYEKQAFAYNHASGVLYYDGATVAPKGSADVRADTLGELSRMSYILTTAPETVEMLQTLVQARDRLDPVTARKVSELWRDYEMTHRVPEEEFVAYQQLTSKADAVWHEAKERSDFALFEPYLQQVFDGSRRLAEYMQPDKDPYDAQLDRFERGLTRETCDAFFAALRQELVPLIDQVKAHADRVDDTPLHRSFPVAIQREFSDFVMDVMDIDRNHCIIGETEHPFTINFSRDDVRITTNYQEDLVASSLYSVVHEGGHALYELHVGRELSRTCLGGGVSMAIHESQSRFYENIIGRSRAFCGVIYPWLREHFAPRLDDVSQDAFYRMINKAQPSLIRTEADELTYCLHVMVRYEIEKQLIGGTLIFIVLLSLMALAHSMKGGSGGNMTFVWIAAIVIFGIAEAATAGLVSIWFVVGAVAALVATELGAALWLQFAVFLVVSILALIATRPLARKMLDKTIVPTNADRVLHHEAKVTETVDNENATGAVYIDGKTWTARSEDGNIIPKGKMARIVRMEGVKLYVRESKEPSERRE